MQKIDLDKFAKNSQNNRKGYRRFITQCESHPPKKLDKLIEVLDKEVWKEIDCLSCANCCKKMTPTFTGKDIQRAAGFLNMSTKEFKEKWLTQDRVSKDWVNVSQPCQFLDLNTNMCTIYEARPADCAGFPHLAKHKAADYMHIHKQNLEYCPATLRFVELLKTATADQVKAAKEKGKKKTK